MTLHVVLRKDGTVLREEDFAVDLANPLTFGRSAQNRLHVPDDRKLVSSRHGRIEQRGSDYYVVDLDSVNGTRLGDMQVKGEAVLTDPAKILVGEFEITVQLVASPVATPARPKEPDPGGTIVNIRPDDMAQEVWQQLCTRHAALRRDPAGERTAKLAAELRDRLRALDPAQQRAVLKRIQALAGGTRDAAPAQSGLEEQLLQTGLTQLQRLAQAFVARPLTQSGEVKRFVSQVETFLRLVLAFLTQSLRGRAEFQDQFGAEVTMLFQRGNNPLKNLEAKDLAARLFEWSEGQSPGEQTAHLEGILRDLTQHQLGLLAGATEAITSVTERLAPATIEALAQKDAGLLTSKGAKAWEIYQKIYRELLEEKSKLFQEVIQPAIRKGYLQIHDNKVGAKDTDRRT